MAATRNRFTTLDLSPHFNNNGISYAQNRKDGSFNIWGNTFPAETLPASLSIVEVHGIPFIFPPKEDGLPNNICCDRQILAIPPESYDWIHVLAAAERRSEDPVYLHYINGGIDSEWLRVSDFWPETPAHFGELEAFRSSYMHYPRHTQYNMQPVIWLQRVPVVRREHLKQISLPDNLAIHLFALTLEKGK